MVNLEKQNEIIISLLARLVMGENKIKDLVTKNKQNPEKYLRGYNSCNGVNTLTDIAKIVGVTVGTLSPILKNWEKEGIIYNIETETSPKYKSLMKIK